MSKKSNKLGLILGLALGIPLGLAALAAAGFGLAAMLWPTGGMMAVPVMVTPATTTMVPVVTKTVIPAVQTAQTIAPPLQTQQVVRTVTQPIVQSVRQGAPIVTNVVEKSARIGPPINSIRLSGVGGEHVGAVMNQVEGNYLQSPALGQAFGELPQSYGNTLPNYTVIDNATGARSFLDYPFGAGTDF